MIDIDFHGTCIVRQLCRRVIQRDRMIAELNHRFASNLVSIESTYQVCLHILINDVPRLTFL